MANEFRELILRAQLQRGFVRERDVMDAGIGHKRWLRAVDEGIWIEIVPGHFRHMATLPTFELLARAGDSWIGLRGGLHAASALRWLGIDGPRPDRPEFLVDRSHRWRVVPLKLHTTRRFSKTDFVRHQGVRTSTATRAIIDFAGVSPTAALVETAIDSAIRLRRTALPRLVARMSELSGPGMSGVVLLRELLLDSGGESYLERRFLGLARSSGLPRPDTQVVFHTNGTFVARVDFRFPGTNVVVEVSGRLGHSSDRDRQRDARRRNALQTSGLTVLEFTTADVIDDPSQVLLTLEKAGLVRPLPLALALTT